MSSYALLAHTQANATAGGAASSGDNTFVKLTLNAELTDSDNIVSISSNNITFASAGTYTISAQIGYGYANGLQGVGFRAGLYNVTSSAFVPDAGGAVEILSTDGTSPNPGTASTANAYVQISGRFIVGAPANTFAIYGAGKAVSGTWYDKTYAQGTPATGVTTGSKYECYKLVRIVKE